MNRVKLILSVTLMFLMLSYTAQTNWKISQSNITFKIKNAGITVNGNLSSPKGIISFDEQNYKTGKVEVSIEVNTLKTGVSKRDEHLKKPEYFDVAAFPTIKLNSRFFGQEREGHYVLHANLLMKGITKAISIPFTYTEQGNNATFNTTFKINRLDFGIGSKSIILSDDVTIQIELTTAKN